MLITPKKSSGFGNKVGNVTPSQQFRYSDNNSKTEGMVESGDTMQNFLTGYKPNNYIESLKSYVDDDEQDE